MRKTLMVFALSLFINSVFAQTATEFKNAGNTALEAKDYKKALENYDKAIAAWGNEPANYAMLYNAGACAYKLKEYEKAIKYFDQLIAGNYETESAYQYKANSYKFLKKDEEVVKAYTEGLAKNPNSTTLKDGLFKYYRGEGKNHYITGANIFKAASDKVNAQKLKPTDPAYLSEAGKAKKELTTAISLIDKALELNPADDESKKVKAACEQSLKSLP